MTVMTNNRFRSSSSSPRRALKPSQQNGSKDKSQLSRRNHLLNALKITDNKIYELLHEKIIFNSVNEKNRDLRKRSPNLRYDLLNEGEIDFELSKEDDRPSRKLVSLKRYKDHGKLFVKIRYGKDINRIRKINVKKSNIKDGKNIIRIKTKASLTSDDTYETDDIPFNGILSYADGNTYNIAPKSEDRELFNQALLDAKNFTIPTTTTTNDEEMIPEDEDNVVEEDQKWTTPTSKIKSIHIANHEIETWYTAPYPEEYSSKPVLYICEYCLKYMNSPYIMARHSLKCAMKNPPGYEIYRAGSIAIFEVDGRKNTIYCQNLCLLAKLFLNSKTLYYDVDPFMFYVLTELDSQNQYHFVGYFSKEKLNSTNYNVSCILTLPIYQRKGYGNLLIDFSYLLTRREFKLGTPEKPLSDLGLLSYRNYWVVTICYKLRELSQVFENNKKLEISINNISNLTGMIQNDVITALEILEFLIRNPKTGEYALKIDLSKISKVIYDWELKNYTVLQPDKLLFKPVIFGPSGGINTTTTMVMTTDENDNQLMSGISLITSFLKDDLEDSRDLEEQTMEELKDRKIDHDEVEEEEADVDEELDNYFICYPGMDMIKRKRDRIGLIAKQEPEPEPEPEPDIEEEEEDDDDDDLVGEEQEEEEEEEDEEYDEDAIEVGSLTDSETVVFTASEDEYDKDDDEVEDVIDVEQLESESESEDSETPVVKITRNQGRRIRNRRSIGDLI